MRFSLRLRIKSLYLRLKPQSQSRRNVLKLAGGTAGSQVITVAAAPLLTRLYGPESYGVLATFTSILALLNVVSSLRYELAIAVPEDDDEAVALVWLCFTLVAISTVITALGLLLLGDQLVVWLDEPAIKPLLWLLPVGVLLTGLYQPLSYWAIRRKQFGLLAQTKFRQSIFGVATNLAAAPLGTIGLLLGQIVSQSSGFLAIIRQSVGLLLQPTVTPVLLFKTLKRYCHFGIYSSPAGLINTIGNQLPNLIFASAFGVAQLGELALAQRLLLLPAGLIGRSVGQVFLSKASDSYRVGKLQPLMLQTAKRLLAYGLIVSLLVSLFFAPLVPLLFGSEWYSTSLIIPLLSPLFVAQIIISPISMAFIAAQINVHEMFAQIALTSIRTGAILTSVNAGLSFNSSIFVFSVASLVGYSFYGFVLFRSFKSIRAPGA